MNKYAKFAVSFIVFIAAMLASAIFLQVCLKTEGVIITFANALAGVFSLFALVGLLKLGQKALGAAFSGNSDDGSDEN